MNMKHMKYALYSFFAITLMCIACHENGSKKNNDRIIGQGNELPAAQSTLKGAAEAPSEIFVGEINGAHIKFEHWNYTRFRFTERNRITLGALNTERGFQDDEDATLFIMNFDKPEAERRYLVRHSDGTVALLEADAQRSLRKE
jgi:hypothetical protein